LSCADLFFFAVLPSGGLFFSFFQRSGGVARESSDPDGPAPRDPPTAMMDRERAGLWVMESCHLLARLMLSDVWVRQPVLLSVQ